MALQTRPLVWIVDDVESVRLSLTAVLESADFQVRAFIGPVEFLAQFEAGEKGCLVVDQHMPDMTGVELLQQLAAAKTLPPAILISGKADAELKAQVLATGAAAMMGKPVDGDELIDKILQLLA